MPWTCTKPLVLFWQRALGKRCLQPPGPLLHLKYPGINTSQECPQELPCCSSISLSPGLHLAPLCPTEQWWVWCPSSPCGTPWDALATDGMLAMDRIQVLPILQPVWLLLQPHSTQQFKAYGGGFSCLTAGGSGKSSSCLPLPRKEKMLNKQPWKHTPLFTQAPPLLFLHSVTGTATNVSAALSLQETPPHMLSCMWSPSLEGAAEQRLPLLVLYNFVWLLIIDGVFPIAHQWNLLSRAFCKLSPWRADLSFHLLLFFLASQILHFPFKNNTERCFKNNF